MLGLSWYWFDNKPFLESALNDGFLKAKNVDKIKFYLMWANHDANTAWDIRRSHEMETIWPRKGITVCLANLLFQVLGDTDRF